MRHIIEKIVMEEDAIMLVDTAQESEVKVVVASDGQDFVISTQAGSYIVVDVSLFMGALRSLSALYERERVQKRRA